ncbi:hypothetical protein [Campylobacter curvus]|jgi:hypothetical protein|uniref:hypothetical protein n=1 Tax=Campylobacter curvus TaxID=200 RepID=UPI0014700A2A|nr:hypothetical protein [Campylobacter curvus]
MKTRSSIWRLKENGRYDGIYCEWNGYISNNGKILFKYYQDESKIKELIELGSISTLEATPATCVAFHRDRNEKLQIIKDIQLGSFLPVDSNTRYKDYNYLFENGSWYVTCKDYTHKQLTQEFIDKAEENYE